jgi:D-alanyl-D-alanine-carboxypeptidase/D-alanyl-D-alanine-endopeptidase
MKRFLLSWLAGLSVTLLGLCSSPSPAADDKDSPWRQKARELLTPLLEQHKLNQVVIGVINPLGQREIESFGERPAELERLDGKTIFEIGSITKVFTDLLLADAVQRGDLKLDDPVRQLLPTGTPMPKRGDQEITLEELATHTSGLPRIPMNLTGKLVFDPKLQKDPYSQFDETQLYASLEKLKLPQEAKPKVAYSNLGVGLLGFAFSKKFGKPYEALLKERILLPCSMHDTKIVLKAEEAKRLLPGHDPAGKPCQNWTFQDTTAGAGALRSTAEDMLTFLEYQMGRKQNGLSEAMLISQQPLRDAGEGGKIGLGWFSPPQKKVAPRVWWHNGGTGGYSSFAAFCRQPAVGVVVLSNRFVARETDKLGMEIITVLRK